ncbi:hypothetical protein ALC53_04515 [Atta colombica]|uniref:Uncharacterized protein n=1 Tax=Atta colombica TaxID=520822 RepID=A0A195BLU3_9HYME|nr:hypothetical protein ALC53_04515 [Atta colombica]
MTKALFFAEDKDVAIFITDGLILLDILDVFDPYFADGKNNDANVLNSLMKERSSLHLELLWPEDVIVDRKFRDSITTLEEYNNLQKIVEDEKPIIIPGSGDLTDDEEQQHEIVAALMQIFLVYFARYSTMCHHLGFRVVFHIIRVINLRVLHDASLHLHETLKLDKCLNSKIGPSSFKYTAGIFYVTHSIQHDDVICPFEKLQLMSDEYSRFTMKILSDALSVEMLSNASIHRAQRIVEQIEIRLSVNRPCEIDSCSLASRQGYTSIADQCHVSLWKLLEILPGIHKHCKVIRNNYHLLCYSKKKTVVVCLYFFLKMNRQSLHSLLPGVFHIQVDTLINPDNAKSTSFFLARRGTSFTYNGLVTLQKLFEVVYQGTSFDHLLIPLALVGLSEEYVLSDGSTENPSLLTSVTDAAVDLHLTFRQTDLSENRGQERTLAATHHADHRIQLALFYFQIQILQSVLRLFLLPLGSNVDHIDGPVIHIFREHWTIALHACPFSSHTLPGLLDSILPEVECIRVHVLLPSSDLLPPRSVASPIESFRSLPLSVHTYSLQSFNVLAGLEVNLADPIKYPTDNHDRHQEDRIDHAGHYQRSEHQHIHLTGIQDCFRNRTIKAMYKLTPVWKNLINIGPLTMPRDVPSRPSFNFSGSSSSSSSSVPPLLASGHLLCYSKKKTVVVCLYFFLKMNRHSLHSLLPGVLYIRVDSLINPDNAKSTSFFPARRGTSFTYNSLVALRKLFEVAYQGTSLDHLLVPLALVGLSEEYVLSDGSTENPSLLTSVTDAAVDLHLTFRQTDLSENRGQERTLAATHHADHRIQLALFYFQIQILQSVLRLFLLPLGSNVDHIDGPLLKYVRFEISFEYFYIIYMLYMLYFVAGRRLRVNNVAALELVEHKETLEPTYSYHTLSQLSEAAHEHASHSVCKNVEIGRNDEDLIGSQIVAEHQHGYKGAVKRHTSCEEIEGHINAANVRALGDHSKFKLTRQLHHSAEWLLPRVHFDHLHPGNDFVHQPDPFVGLDGSLETKL